MNSKKTKLFKELQMRFNIKDFGEAKQCLGIKITKNTENKSISIDQKEYIISILNKFGLFDTTDICTLICTLI